MASKTRILSSLLNDSGKIKPDYFTASLSDFDDIDLSTQPTENKILRYDSSTQTFVPGDPVDVDSNDIVLETQVDSDIQDIIGVPPETLNTLIEIENTLDSVSTIDTIIARVAGYKCEVFDGDGTTKIFSTRTHKAGYTSVTVDGIEMIDRVTSTADTTSANRLTSGYDFYSGTGTTAYQVTAEYTETSTTDYGFTEGDLRFLIYSSGTSKWYARYGNSAGTGYGYTGPWAVRVEGSIGAESEIGDILKTSSSGDFIWYEADRSAYFGSERWYQSGAGISDLSLKFSSGQDNRTNPTEYTAATPYYYKVQSITAPSPNHAQQSSDKIYFLTAPPNGSKIVVRYYE